MNRQHLQILKFSSAAKMRSGRVAIAVPAEAPWNEVSMMAIDASLQLGVDAFPVTDGDEQAFDADQLVLVGSGRWYPKFEEMARRLEHRRPHIQLWHLQPLPPPVFTRRANELGQKLLRCRWDDLCGSWLSPIADQLPDNRHIRSAIRRLLGVQVLYEFERIGGPDYGNISWEDLQLIFEEASWLAKHFADPGPWIDEIASDTPTRIAFLRQHGIPARFVPLGYHEAWGREGAGIRDVDVMVFGNLRSPARAAAVRQVLARLQEWGYSTIFNPVFPVSSLRVPLLQRTRIVLNVLRMPWEFPGLRLFPSVACGALVVSNVAVQNEPFMEGVHFVPAPRARIAESIASLLDHEEERVRRSQVARQHMQDHLSMRASMARLLRVESAAPPVHRAAA